MSFTQTMRKPAAILHRQMPVLPIWSGSRAMTCRTQHHTVACKFTARKNHGASICAAPRLLHCLWTRTQTQMTIPFSRPQRVSLVGMRQGSARIAGIMRSDFTILPASMAPASLTRMITCHGGMSEVANMAERRRRSSASMLGVLVGWRMAKVHRMLCMRSSRRSLHGRRLGGTERGVRRWDVGVLGPSGCWGKRSGISVETRRVLHTGR